MKSSPIALVVVLASLATTLVGVALVAANGETNESGWALTGRWSDTCSCEVACPCFFGAPATEGFCEGTSLLEIEEGHYDGVELDGLAAIVSMRIGEWTRIYVAETATPEQAEALGFAIPLALPFLGMGELEAVEIVPISVERTEATLKYAAPESAVEIEIVMGANGEPIRIANLPMKGLPFPDVHDHVQYRSVRSWHDSKAHRFEWHGRNGFVSRIDRAGELPHGEF